MTSAAPSFTSAPSSPDAPIAAPRFREPQPGTRLYDTVDSPIGELLLRGDGASLTGLHMVGPAPDAPDRVRREDGPDLRGARRDPATFAAVREQLAAYFAGELTQFTLPLAPSGTPFQLAVWNALCDIPYGRTASYGDIAHAVGAPPSASRAVGTANGRNPIAVVVPCHRVIGADGGLVGFGGGLERKRRLLTLEGSILI